MIIALKIIFVICNVILLAIPYIMIYIGFLKKQDCRFRTILKLVFRTILILVGSIVLVAISNVTWWAVISFMLFHLINILFFRGQRKMDVYLR